MTDSSTFPLLNPYSLTGVGQPAQKVSEILSQKTSWA
jgi:hypothetical protein